MKLAVLSDLHGNIEAFRACINYCEKENVDEYIFLGDYTGELPDPQLTLNLLYELNRTKTCHIIRGNREDYALSGLGAGHSEWDEFKSVVGTIRYNYKNTTGKDLEFFSSLPITMKLQYDGLPSIRLCHGAPDATNGVLNRMDDQYISSIEEDIILFGHTHKQYNEVRCNKRILNPGSVGVSLDGKGAGLLILESFENDFIASFVNVKYDIDKEIAHMHASGLYGFAPYWTVITEQILRGGTISHGIILKRAMEMMYNETGSCTWPAISEEAMGKAAKEFGF